MGNICCRRVGYSPNGTEVDNGRCHQQQVLEPQQPKSPLMSSAYHNAGDDCAINELLEGRMDLDVVLPDGRKVKLTVERRTPMMDLLVQAASATKISPAGHTIHVYGDAGKGGGTLHYKPSTPIGSLDANTICIVAKKDAQDATGRRVTKTANRPFEPTFRVQVHLPRNQLTVVRVSPRVKISELRNMVCQEKGMDTGRYQLVRPSARGQPLSGDMTLADYGSTEITLLSNSCIESHICNSTSHIMPYSKRIEEQKKKTGILRLLAEDANQKAQRKPNTTSSLQRTTPAIKITEAPHPGRYKPKKRRPAPPPPPPTLPEPPFHSRQSSSDSSGYHEATSSFLHEENCAEDKASSDSSGVSSLDAKVTTVHNTKKRKAPPPPPPPPGEEAAKPWELEGGGQPQANLMTVDVKIRSNVTEVPTDPSNETEEPVPQEQAPLPEPEPVPEKTEPCNLKEASPERSTRKEDEAVTRVALVALHARIEQDVTQQEIASSIQAAFHSLDSGSQRTAGPSLLAIKQRGGRPADPSDTDDHPCGVLLKRHSIGEQPFESTTVTKSSSLESESTTKASVTEKSIQSVTGSRSVEGELAKTLVGVSEKQVVAEKPSKSAGGVRSTEPLSAGFASVDKPTESAPSGRIPTAPAGLRTSSITQKSSDNAPLKAQSTAPSSGFTKTSVEGQSVRHPDQSSKSSSSGDPRPVVLAKVSTKGSDGTLNTRQSLNLTAVGNSAVTVSRSISAVGPIGFTKKYTGVSAPLTTQQSSIVSSSSAAHVTEASPVDDDFDAYPLQKSSARLNFEDGLQSFPPPPSEFRGHEALLIDDEAPPIPCPPTFRSTTPPKSTSSTTLRRSSSLLSLTDSSAGANRRKSSGKSRSLQRSLSDLTVEDKGEFEAEQERLQIEYLKLQRQFVLWQQQLLSNHAMLREECIVPQYARTLRQSHSLPEGEDYPDDDSTTGPCPLVSRSLSYEPTRTRCSTLPRSTINIPEFGSGPISNGTSTLRSSKTKSYFKPPQVRVSTKNRQRLPPEIRKDGDLDIYDDSKILSTILPSLKLISEGGKDDDLDLILKKNKIGVEVPKKVPPPVPNKVPKPDLNRQNNERNRVQGLKEVVQSNGSDLPPPPPPLPVVVEKPMNGVVKTNGVSKTVVQKKVITPQLDPREQLMQEIRKCGGRTALRKISLDIAS